MRVTHSHLWSWPEVRRGAEREIHDLTTRLAARGHDVRVVSGTRTGLVSRSWDGGVRVTRVRTPVMRRLTAEAGWALPATAALALSRADVLHAWHYGDGAAASLVRGRRPLVLKITGSVPRGSTELRRPDRALLQRALEGASEVWVNDPFVVEAMGAWGVPMRVVPPGVDTAFFTVGGTRSAVPTVLAVGAAGERRKRIDVLCRLWPSVLAEVPGARLRVAGAVTEAERRALLDDLPGGAAASVGFLGALSSEQLRDEYRSAWAFCAPAADEAFGLATVEALATGTPVVGTATGATPGLLAGEADKGSVHALDDPDGMAAALVGRLQSPPTREQAESRSASVAGHGWSSRVEEVEGHYRRLLAD